MILKAISSDVLEKLDAKWNNKDRLQRWSTYYVNGQIVIKRGIFRSKGGPTFQRLPVRFFRHLPLEEQKELAKQLNIGHVRKLVPRRFVNKTNIPTPLLKDFRNRLLMDIPNQNTARCVWSKLDRYVLTWFSSKDCDYTTWQRKYDTEWGKYLLSTGLSPRSLRWII